MFIAESILLKLVLLLTMFVYMIFDILVEVLEFNVEFVDGVELELLFICAEVELKKLFASDLA